MRSILFFALLASASVVQASDNSAPAPAVVRPIANALVDGEKMVCRREQVSGSNIPAKRVCRLKRDLDADQREARDAAQQMTTPTGGSSSSN